MDRQEAAPVGALARRLRARRATIGVVGLGYVGVPLAAAFVAAGYRTVGLDTDPSRVSDLNAGRPYIGHLGQSVFGALAADSRFEATTAVEALGTVDAIVICVPTPLDGNGAPDLSAVERTAKNIAQHGRPDQLVVLESTTYPGTTRQLLLPALRRGVAADDAGLRVAYSPERVDPGGKSALTSIPKLVAGVDDESTLLAVALYEGVFDVVHPVASVEIAEAAKLLENTFRAVNIALVNELKISLQAQGIDIWEVIEAAASKPFGFVPFYPGPGVGGHCIPVDPVYLAWKGRRAGAPLTLTETAVAVNATVPGHVVERLAAELSARGRDLGDAAVVLVGVSYKPNIADLRESPAYSLVDLLADRGAGIAYHDPHVAELDSGAGRLSSIPWEADRIASFDAAIICTDHDVIDYSLLAAARILIVDTRNAMARRGFPELPNVVRA